MKRFLFIAVLALGCSSALARARPTPSPTPNAIETKAGITPQMARQEIYQRIEVIVAKMQGAIDTEWGQLTEARAETATAQTEIGKIASERDSWATYGQDQAKKREAAEKAVLAQKAGLLRRDIIIGVMGLLIIVYLGLKFWLKVPFL